MENIFRFFMTKTYVLPNLITNYTILSCLTLYLVIAHVQQQTKIKNFLLYNFHIYNTSFTSFNHDFLKTKQFIFETKHKIIVENKKNVYLFKMKRTHKLFI